MLYLFCSNSVLNCQNHIKSYRDFKKAFDTSQRGNICMCTPITIVGWSKERNQSLGIVMHSCIPVKLWHSFRFYDSKTRIRCSLNANIFKNFQDDAITCLSTFSLKQVEQITVKNSITKIQYENFFATYFCGPIWLFLNRGGGHNSS